MDCKINSKNNINLQICFKDGNSSSIIISSNATVGDLRLKIKNCIGHNDPIRLIHNNLLLYDNNLLKHYRVNDQDKILLTPVNCAITNVDENKLYSSICASVWGIITGAGVMLGYNVIIPMIGNTKSLQSVMLSTITKDALIGAVMGACIVGGSCCLSNYLNRPNMHNKKEIGQ